MGTEIVANIVTINDSRMRENDRISISEIAQEKISRHFNCYIHWLRLDLQYDRKADPTLRIQARSWCSRNRFIIGSLSLRDVGVEVELLLLWGEHE